MKLVHKKRSYILNYITKVLERSCESLSEERETEALTPSVEIKEDLTGQKRQGDFPTATELQFCWLKHQITDHQTPVSSEQLGVLARRGRQPRQEVD